MAADVLFNQAVISLPLSDAENAEHFYLGCGEWGSKNFRDDDGRIVREWHVGLLNGTGFRFMEKVIYLSGDCEGSMIQSARGKMLPENFIKRWRAEMRNAIPMSVWLGDEGAFHLNVSKLTEVLVKSNSYNYRECLDALDAAEGVTINDQGDVSFAVCSDNLFDMACLFDKLSHATTLHFSTSSISSHHLDWARSRCLKR